MRLSPTAHPLLIGQFLQSIFHSQLGGQVTGRLLIVANGFIGLIPALSLSRAIAFQPPVDDLLK